MCTVVIVPAGDGGYLLGHNRDERRTRSRGTLPAGRSVEGVRFLAPGDPDGGGTWIGVNDLGLSACLLNAADAPGRVVPDAPPSRGLLVGEAMGCRTLDQAVARFSDREADWSRRRAFHLVLASRGRGGSFVAIARLSWDGARALWNRPEAPALFTSSTFDGTGVEIARREAWSRWLAAARDPAASLGGWLAGHEPERGPYSVCMHRDDAGTVSRTLVSAGPRAITLDYVDGSPCDALSPRTVVKI